MMMIGEAVSVLRRSQSGIDEMGDPIFEWTGESVQNVLVRPLSGSDMSDQLHPSGVKVEYSLAFPKSYTAGCGPLREARVALVERGMDGSDADKALRIVGSPDATRPCPTEWDMIAMAGRADG